MHRARVDHHNGKFWLIQRIRGVGERFHVFVLGVVEPPDSRIRSLVQHCATLAAILLRRPEEFDHARAELASLAMALHLGKDSGSTGAMGWLFEDLADSHGKIPPVVFMCLDAVMVERTVSEIRKLFGALSNKVRIAVGLPTPVEELSSRQVDLLQIQAQRAQIGHIVDPHNQAPLWLEIRSLVRFQQNGPKRFLVAWTSMMLNMELPWLRPWAPGSKTAEFSSRCHRQTVRTRLNTIELICELDLSSPLTLTELVLISILGLGRS
ncbi:hypothetical protein GP475_00470 [Corynebacterium poyangense]|uniref:PucR C-terminal helix-turn-helix domain-containing protein n=1 Tax=Corynebacterium poyangense TaxID=2684405 RepID=A0A7H0SL48_9CORY|nr:hypothetical protein [Corynebacterium poyangense]QNQ89273.1 hypothetical protein GP475_00470 [Corynebacterium poyangense]